MLRTFHSDEVSGPRREAPKGTVIIEVVSRPTIVTYEAAESRPRCWVGNARVNPDRVQDALAGKDPGSIGKVEAKVEPAIEAAIEGEADWFRYDDSYEDLAEAGSLACAAEVSERRRAASEGRENRRAWRKMRRHYTVVTPVGLKYVRKSASKTGDVCGRKHRSDDIDRYTDRTSNSFLYTPVDRYPDLDLDVDDEWADRFEIYLPDMGMVSTEALEAEESMLWAAQYNEDDEYVESIMPTYEDVAA